MKSICRYVPRPCPPAAATFRGLLTSVFLSISALLVDVGGRSRNQYWQWHSTLFTQKLESLANTLYSGPFSVCQCSHYRSHMLLPTEPAGSVLTPLAKTEHGRVPESSPHERLVLPGGPGGEASVLAALTCWVCENGGGLGDRHAKKQCALERLTAFPFPSLHCCCLHTAVLPLWR